MKGLPQTIWIRPISFLYQSMIELAGIIKENRGKTWTVDRHWSDFIHRKGSNRHKKANNEFVANYDPKHTKSFLSYKDANNLYGWAMSQPLPTGYFRLLEQNEIDISRMYLPFRLMTQKVTFLKWLCDIQNIFIIITMPSSGTWK